MKFSFKLEDLVAIAIVALAGLLVFFGMTYRMQKAYGRTRTPSSERILDLPMITSAKKVGAAKPQASTQLYKIGVIDTGYDKKLDDKNVKVCPSGHWDFMSDSSKVASTHFHGTAVAQTIADELQDVNYCIVFYQVGTPLGITAEALGQALKKASHEGLVALNISLEGRAYSFEERQSLFTLTSKGTAVFVAAGNRHANLDSACLSYPACYALPNLYVVGATQDNGEFVANYSNYGLRVSVWKDGDIDFNGETERGTSFASPRALGDYVRSLSLVGK